MLLGFVLLIAGLTLACQPGQGRLPERQRDQTLGNESGSGPEQERERLYVGSKACSACHSEIYKAWQTTSHSYTVLTADEARRAGYPLPRTRSKLRSWSDVSYVVGGRERITYADASGNVQRESYHHRVGDWDGFPSLPMAACGGCHFTGFGSGDSHPEDPALPGRWVERSIGCERCHGPGGRHVTSYDARDTDVELKRQVSEVLRRAGELERAEAYFRWLSDHRPEEWLPLYRLGTILIQREDYVEAIRVLEQAIRVAPTEGDAYAALGLAFLRTGSQGDAIEALELGRFTLRSTRHCTRILASLMPRLASSTARRPRSSVLWSLRRSRFRACTSRTRTWRSYI